ncbi:MAG TPA: Ni/Fe-hydrogenase cytochrome b subunit [Ignavibacteriaceae bacterium]|nr:Ni/Fe-hydrogenase cytochrome b subunit [Ignavibacteriaceae bacterium]
MKAFNLPKITFWRAVAVIIVMTGLYSTFLRFSTGLQQTALKDSFPWGLWIGFDVLCGVGLAAGGFTICAVTHIFNIKQFKPLTKPAILTAFLGYVLVVVGLLMDLGKPWNIWHAIIMWNFNSVMFEVAWCVMLYTTVLFLEFVPVVLERFKLYTLQNILKKVSVPIYILGIILSTLHQSSLGSLFLIIPTKMSPLWYSSLLPVYFYLSAISVGFAMIIFEAFLSARAFDKELELNLLSKIGFISVIVLGINFALKMIDLTFSNKWGYLAQLDQASLLYILEALVGVIIPFFMLTSKKVRENKKWLYIASCMIVGGFIFNRLNVSITAVSNGTGIFYFPSFNEISITLMLVVLGMWAFRLIVKNFPVFNEPVRS